MPRRRLSHPKDIPGTIAGPCRHHARDFRKLIKRLLNSVSKRSSAPQGNGVAANRYSGNLRHLAKLRRAAGCAAVIDNEDSREAGGSEFTHHSRQSRPGIAGVQHQG
jgi:hypothetical protein